MITSFEVLKYSGAGRDYPTALFCRLIPQIEQEFVRKCIGQDLWNYLKESLTPTPANVLMWVDCDVYSDGDVVNYFGTLFTSLVDNNNTLPETGVAEWELFERFTTEGANLIWDLYLVNILAMTVYKESLVQTTFRSGAGGLVINSGDSTGFRAAKKDEIQDVRSLLSSNIERATTNLVEWLENNATEYELPMPDICSGSNCNTQGKYSRRWNFRKSKTVTNTEWT